jgi:hypothetical protein
MQKAFLLSLACLGAISAQPALAQDPAPASTPAPAAAPTAPSDEIAELRKQIEALTGKVNDLEQKLNQARLEQPVFGTGTSGNGNGGGKAVVAPAPAPTESVPSESTSGGYVAPKETNLALFNPEISAAIDVIGSYSHRADNANFIVRDAEIMIQSNVDQLAHAYAVFNAETEFDPTVKTNSFDSIKLGIEEAAIETTNLPWGLKVKAGQFFADFTRLGKVHSHELPFTDRPLSLDSIIGGEDKSRGVELTWVPAIGHYVRFTAGAVDNIGADRPLTSLINGSDTFAFEDSSHRSFGDITYYGRAASIFELGPQVTLNVGGDYSHGRDQGERQIGSGDFKLSWVPKPDTYDLFEFSGEYLWTQQHGELNSQLIEGGPNSPTTGTATAHGGYVYAQYRIGKAWQPGVRFDYLHSDTIAVQDFDSDRDLDGFQPGHAVGDTRTYSAYLSYNFSEFNRLRLEVSYINGNQEITNGGRDDWQAYVQWTVTLGPHKHPFSP